MLVKLSMDADCAQSATSLWKSINAVMQTSLLQGGCVLPMEALSRVEALEFSFEAKFNGCSGQQPNVGGSSEAVHLLRNTAMDDSIGGS